MKMLLMSCLLAVSVSATAGQADICFTKVHVLEVLDGFTKHLSLVIRALETGDRDFKELDAAKRKLTIALVRLSENPYKCGEKL